MCAPGPPTSPRGPCPAPGRRDGGSVVIRLGAGRSLVAAGSAQYQWWVCQNAQAAFGLP